MRPAPQDFNVDIRLHQVALHRAGDQPKPDLSFLISSLNHPDVEIWSHALHILHRILPMASLYERWHSRDMPDQSVDSRLPDWIVERCDGWGEDHDFITLSADLLTTSGACVQQQFMERLASFYGADRLIAARLKSVGHKDLASRFEQTVAGFREKQFPKQLTIIPTLACQLKCRYCYSAGMPQVQSNTMTSGQLRRLLDWAHTDGIKRICLAGGEPTIYRHLDNFVEYASDYEMAYFLSTNGLFSRKILDLLLANPPLSVSLHINPEIYQTERLQLFIDNTRALVDSGIMTAFRFNLTSTQNGEYRDYLDLCEQVGVNQVRMAVPVPNFTGSNEFINLYSDDLSAYATVIDRLVAASRKRRIEVHLSKPFPPCLLSQETVSVFFENGSYNSGCQVHLLQGTQNLTVFPDMRFSPCLGLNQQSGESIMAYGGIYQAAETFSRTLHQLSRIPLLEQCQGCPLANGGRCVGACLSYRVNRKHHAGAS